MTRLYFIRHGETDANIGRRFQGHLDVSLNENGRRQARLLSTALSGFAFEAIYTSDLSRAAETAAVLAHSHGLAPIPEPRLREIFVGDWQGLRHDEVAVRWPAEYPSYSREGWLHCPAPAGETLSELSARANAAVAEILDLHPNGEVAVVTHGVTLNSIILHMLGAGLESIGRIAMENTSITTVTAHDQRFRIWGVNDTSHLRGGAGA